MNRYTLTYSEILSTLLLNNKDRFIKQLPIEEDVKDKYIEFFRSHANLEGKIDWQKVSKNPQDVIEQIKELIEKKQV